MEPSVIREIRGSEDIQMKMGRDRKTSRILSHRTRATALPHPPRRKRQGTEPRRVASLRD